MKKGFTLIELLVVVLIIGILSAVALPQYEKAVTKSRLGTMKAIVESVIKNGEEYYLANGVYPKSLEELTIPPPTPVSKRTNSPYEYYLYEWGQCDLSSSAGNVSFGCYNEASKIGYGARFLESPSMPAQRNCSVHYPRPAAAVSVCQAETGKKRPYTSSGGSPGGWDSYAY